MLCYSNICYIVLLQAFNRDFIFKETALLERRVIILQLSKYKQHPRPEQRIF